VKKDTIANKKAKKKANAKDGHADAVDGKQDAARVKSKAHAAS